LVNQRQRGNGFERLAGSNDATNDSTANINGIGVEVFPPDGGDF